MTPLSTNGISARLLLDAAERRFLTEEDTALDVRYVLMCDLFIKARSYARLNKPAFVASFILGLAVIGWPLLEVLYPDQTLIASAMSLTVLSALFALSVGIYSVYRQRQTAVESLMRVVLYSNEGQARLSAEVAKHMQVIDAGFDFQSLVDLKDTKDGPEG